MTDPFFIVGAPRSGTTVARLALNAHPELAVPDETNFFPAIYERYARRPDAWPHAVNAFLEVCAHKLQPPVDLDVCRARLLALEVPDYAALLNLPLSHWGRAEGKPRWGEKTPTHVFYAHDIIGLFPGATVIEMVRDPRAVIASMKRFPWTGDDTALNARYWRDSVRRGGAILSTALSADRRLRVRYEDLVAEPAAALQTICDFLGHDFDPGMTTFYRESEKYLENVWTENVRRPIRSDEGAWRDQLTARDVAIVEAICGEEMDALSYARSGATLSPRNRAALRYKESYVRWKQHRHPEQRYHIVTYRQFGRGRHIVAAPRQFATRSSAAISGALRVAPRRSA
jgi:hypothetical protein